jgi:hypothetical protein
MASRRKLRILCFHGYAQNATIFRKRTGALRKALAGIADPLFINAPHVVTVDGAAPGIDQPPYENHRAN